MDRRALVAFHHPVCAHCFFIYLFFCLVTMSASRRGQINSGNEKTYPPSTDLLDPHSSRSHHPPRPFEHGACGWLGPLVVWRPALSRPSLPHLLSVWTIDVGHPCCTRCTYNSVRRGGGRFAFFRAAPAPAAPRVRPASGSRAPSVVTVGAALGVGSYDSPTE